MNTVIFPVMEQVEARAAEWIAVIDRGISAVEEQELDTWLEESPIHGEVLVKCASMWDLLDVLKPISKLLPLEEPSSFGDSSTQEEIVSNVGRGRAMALAASLVLSITAALYVGQAYFVENNAPLVNTVTPAEQTQRGVARRSYKTAVGEISNVSLADGSTLELNTDSEVLVGFSDTQRDITLLRGEVFFDVAKNPNIPFVVAVGADRVTAVGTAFSVDLSNPESMEVLVTEGQVRVNRATSELSLSAPNVAYQEIFLAPGQKVVISKNNHQVSNDQDSDSALAWRQGMVLFEGETLAQAIREIDRYTPLSFRILDDEIATIPVGGFFRTGDLDQLLLVLEQNFGVSSYRLGEEILLSKAPQP